MIAEACRPVRQQVVLSGSSQLASPSLDAKAQREIRATAMVSAGRGANV